MTTTAETLIPNAGRLFEPLSPEMLLARPLNEVERKNAPVQLFAAGDLSLVRLGTRVSIVGARMATASGRSRARRLAKELAQEGVTIVSGLAEGIDTAAHEASIAAGGRTVAVLGTPLDRTYPAKNRSLQLKIMVEHLAVSPFAVGSRVFRSNFPHRNRVMALLSDATIIVEASDTSGSISQGWEALRLGRLLFILKSVVEQPNITWPRLMQQYGAQVLTDAGSVTSLLPVDSDIGPAAVAF